MCGGGEKWGFGEGYITSVGDEKNLEERKAVEEEGEWGTVYNKSGTRSHHRKSEPFR